MSCRLSCTIAALLVTSTGGAAADRPDPESPETRAVVSAFGDCVVQEHRKMASEVVLSAAPPDAIRKSYPQLLDGDCLLKASHGNFAAITLGLPFDTFRYALAEALVRLEFAGGVPPDIGQAPPLDHPTFDAPSIQRTIGNNSTPEKLRSVELAKEYAAGFRVMSMFGECVARADSKGSLRLILTRPASKQEDEAFAELHHAMAACLPAGQTLVLRRSPVRGSIAMNLYRLAKARRLAAS